MTPSLERLRALIAACGLELTFGLTRADDSYDEQIRGALSLTPALRLERALSDAQAIRAARAQAADVPAPTYVLGGLRALDRASVSYVLVGELAEVLHGSPLLPITNTVTIVARAGEREHLTAAITAGGGQPAGSLPAPAPSIDAAATFALELYGVELVVAPAPSGTHGYEDLRRDATPLRLDEDLTVPVASLVDLVRIAEASEDHARVPALRRALELATARPLLTPDGTRFDPQRILEVLARHQVQCVVIGGYAAVPAGIEIVTRDIDITPATDPANLQRLADALGGLHAAIRVPNQPPLPLPPDPRFARPRGDLEPHDGRRRSPHDRTAQTATKTCDAAPTANYSPTAYTSRSRRCRHHPQQDRRWSRQGPRPSATACRPQAPAGQTKPRPPRRT